MKHVLVLALALVGAGCAGSHLGNDYGKAYRTAFEAQAERKARQPELLDAEDAREAVKAQHAEDQRVESQVSDH